MSTDAHATALKALLSTAAKAPVMDLDEIKAMGTLPATYVEFYLSRRFGGPQRYDGSRSTNLRRMSTRVVSKSVTNARLVEDRIVTAFEFTTVDLGDTTAHVSYESGGGNFGYDEGWYTALSDWTFGL